MVGAGLLGRSSSRWTLAAAAAAGARLEGERGAYRIATSLRRVA
jgi:hypothetical protein